MVVRIALKYDPSQPRVPAGDERGGQWTSVGMANPPRSLFGMRPFEEGEQRPPRWAHEISTENLIADRQFWLDNYTKNQIAEMAGIHRESVGAVQAAGAFQSPYLIPAGTHLIEQIGAEFGIEPEPLERELLEKNRVKPKWVTKGAIRDDYRANGWSKYDKPLTDEQMRNLVRSVYKVTQDAMRKEGVSYLTVYRGSDQEAYSNILSSWSLDPDVAARFGKVTSITVPASAVWALPFTGFGVPSQLEVLVLNGGEYAEKAKARKQAASLIRVDRHGTVLGAKSYDPGIVRMDRHGRVTHPGRKRYDPSQPRVPAGDPQGGQWTSGGSGYTDEKFQLGGRQGKWLKPKTKVTYEDGILLVRQTQDVEIDLGEGKTDTFTFRDSYVEGSARHQPNSITITRLHVDEQVRGRGVATDLVKTFVHNVPKGYSITTTGVFSPGGRGVLERLVREGWAIPDGSGNYTLKVPSRGTKSGPGSGHHGHSGRPGQVGGSLPSYGDAEFEAAARTENIAEDWPLGGGITDSRLLELKGDGKGVWKEDELVNRAASEVLTDELDDAFGFDVVPRTVYLKNQFGQEGSCQRFISGAEAAIDLYDQDSQKFWQAIRDNRERVEAMMVLDYITGNIDRHYGNVVFDRDGKLWAIDNGCADWKEPRDTGWAEDLDVNTAETKRFALSPSVVERVRAADPARLKAITDRAVAEGFGDAWHRIDYIRRRGELRW